MLNEYLVNKINEEYPNDSERILNGFVKKVPSIRVNRIKSSMPEVLKFLDKNQILYDRVNWFDDAFILNDMIENDIYELEFLKEGKIYMQNLSSMIPPLFFDMKCNDTLLDMAASPGSKTTQIASIYSNKVQITACEVNKSRMEKLKYNLDKQGVSCCYTMLKDAREIDSFFKFDNILLDAPCSGSGTVVKDRNDDSKFNDELIGKITKRQRNLLKKAIEITKKGGIIIYSTCSIFKEENEMVIKEFIDNGMVDVVPINLKDVNLLPSSIDGVLTISPDKNYEGFFIAKLIKK